MELESQLSHTTSKAEALSVKHVLNKGPEKNNFNSDLEIQVCKRLIDTLNQTNLSLEEKKELLAQAVAESIAFTIVEPSGLVPFGYDLKEHSYNGKVIKTLINSQGQSIEEMAERSKAFGRADSDIFLGLFSMRDAFAQQSSIKQGILASPRQENEKYCSSAFIYLYTYDDTTKKVSAVAIEYPGTDQGLQALLSAINNESNNPVTTTKVGLTQPILFEKQTPITLLRLMDLMAENLKQYPATNNNKIFEQQLALVEDFSRYQQELSKRQNEIAKLFNEFLVSYSDLNQASQTLCQAAIALVKQETSPEMTSKKTKTELCELATPIDNAQNKQDSIVTHQPQQETNSLPDNQVPNTTPLNLNQDNLNQSSLNHQTPLEIPNSLDDLSLTNLASSTIITESRNLIETAKAQEFLAQKLAEQHDKLEQSPELAIATNTPEVTQLRLTQSNIKLEKQIAKPLSETIILAQKQAISETVSNSVLSPQNAVKLTATIQTIYTAQKSQTSVVPYEQALNLPHFGNTINSSTQSQANLLAFTNSLTQIVPTGYDSINHTNITLTQNVVPQAVPQALYHIKQIKREHVATKLQTELKQELNRQLLTDRQNVTWETQELNTLTSNKFFSTNLDNHNSFTVTEKGTVIPEKTTSQRQGMLNTRNTQINNISTSQISDTPIVNTVNIKQNTTIASSSNLKINAINTLSPSEVPSNPQSDTSSIKLKKPLKKRHISREAKIKAYFDKEAKKRAHIARFLKPQTALQHSSQAKQPLNNVTTKKPTSKFNLKHVSCSRERIMLLLEFLAEQRNLTLNIQTWRFKDDSAFELDLFMSLRALGFSLEEIDLILELIAAEPELLTEKDDIVRLTKLILQRCKVLKRTKRTNRNSKNVENSIKEQPKEK